MPVRAIAIPASWFRALVRCCEGLEASAEGQAQGDGGMKAEQ